MALTVEDGTIVTNANTYVDVDDLRDYAAARGIALPTSDTECEILIIKAADYVESKRDRYQGVKSDSDQPMQFPRDGVFIDGFELSADEIPRELKYAQMQLACDAHTTDIMPNRLVTTQGAVTKQKVGELEIAYANPTSPLSVPAFARADALLAPLYKRNGLFGVRV